MATVTKKFRDDFDAWAAKLLATGEFTQADIEQIRETVRRDLEPGPDKLRAGLTFLVDGVEMSAAIDDPEERYQMWAEFFADAIVEIEVLGNAANPATSRQP